MTAVIVRLQWPEVCLAADVAKMRAVNNLRGRLVDRYGDTGQLGFDYHFLGCLGEMALAKHVGRYWSGNVGNFDAADVGSRHQVRACALPHHCLILHPPDADDAPYVSALVARIALPLITLRGFVYGREGKLPEFWRDFDRPAFFVPAARLRAMEELEA